MEAKQDHSAAPVKELLQCTIDGCQQIYPSEGYCSVHTKKHDLSLNLQMPQKGAGGGLFADQTPTPTRLIGKCEEVGLFEDLQKVNPFDETFRRAVESGASSVSSLTDDKSPPTFPLIPLTTAPFPRAVEGETLHTPHIFPSGIERSSLLEGAASVGASENVTIASKQPRMKARASRASPRGKQQQEQATATTTTTNITTSSLPSTSSTAISQAPKKTPVKRKTPAPVVDILPKPAPPIDIASIPVIIIPSDPSDPTLPAEGTVLVKEKLKEHLAKVRETGPVPKASAPVSKRQKRTEEKPATASKTEAKPIDGTGSPGEQENIKQKRWKEAAKRYRVRVKKSQDQLLQRNIDLEEENLRLRTQLTELRSAHRSCNVTRAQNAAKQAQLTSQAAATIGRVESVQQEANAMLLNTVEQSQPLHLLQQQQQQQQVQQQVQQQLQLQIQQQPEPMSIPQQRLITSHIIDSNSFNRMPIFIVMGSGAAPQTVVPVVPEFESGICALEEGNG